MKEIMGFIRHANSSALFLNIHVILSCPPYSGTIGLLGQKSPLFFTHGRMMKSQNKSVQDTPFYVDRRHRKIFIDFGNSFQVYENGSIATDNYEGLFVALSISRYPSLTCSDDLLWLGVVYDKYPNWYQISAGVQVIPALGSLSDSTIRKLRTHPLVVAEVHCSMRGLIFILFNRNHSI